MARLNEFKAYMMLFNGSINKRRLTDLSIFDAVVQSSIYNQSAERFLSKSGAKKFYLNCEETLSIPDLIQLHLDAKSIICKPYFLVNKLNFDFVFYSSYMSLNNDFFKMAMLQDINIEDYAYMNKEYEYASLKIYNILEDLYINSIRSENGYSIPDDSIPVSKTIHYLRELENEVINLGSISSNPMIKDRSNLILFSSRWVRCNKNHTIPNSSYSTHFSDVFTSENYHASEDFSGMVNKKYLNIIEKYKIRDPGYLEIDSESKLDRIDDSEKTINKHMLKLYSMIIKGNYDDIDL